MENNEMITKIKQLELPKGYEGVLGYVLTNDMSLLPHDMVRDDTNKKSRKIKKTLLNKELENLSILLARQIIANNSFVEEGLGLIIF